MSGFKIYKDAELKLNDFIEKKIMNYSFSRNFDLGVERRDNISNLSHLISHRILLEFDIVKKILKKRKYSDVEKFIQEVFWRIYWKGWLEHRPKVWKDFIEFETNTVNKMNYEKAINGKTNISCFDEWVSELKNYNYLHNHSRMWFASIWIFTLKLPWQLGAKFFMEHLLDGDSASNTLSWRWVAGLQTKGKNYLARSSNIEKYTNGRFKNIKLNEDACPIEEDKIYETEELKKVFSTHTKSKILLMFETDLFFSNRTHLLDHYDQILMILLENADRKIKLSKTVLNYKRDLMVNFQKIFKNSRIISSLNLKEIVLKDKVIDLIYPFIGENLDYITKIESKNNISFNNIVREEDLMCWQYSKKGFFNFKKNIPVIIERI